MIHGLEVKALQVRNVTRDVEGEYLPFAGGRERIAAGEAFDDEAALRWSITFVDNDLVRTNSLRTKG